LRRYLHERAPRLAARAAKVEIPHPFSIRLIDELGELWKYCVGDYRLIAKILDREIRILVVRIGRRRDVYR
jgi:mRNA interferase RelE/StbE